MSFELSQFALNQSGQLRQLALDWPLGTIAGALQLKFVEQQERVVQVGRFPTIGCAVVAIGRTNF